MASNTVRLIIGILLTISGVGGIINGDVAAGIACLIGGLLLIPAIGDKVFNKQARSKAMLGFSNLSGGASYAIKSIDYSCENDVIASVDRALTSLPKPLSLKAKRTAGKEIYLKFLEQAVSDLRMSGDEIQNLALVQDYFGLSNLEVKSLKDMVNQAAVTKLIAKQYEDKILSDTEQKEIINFASYLELDLAQVEKIKFNIAINLFNTVLNDKLKDKKLSPSEETELTDTLNRLQLDETAVKAMMPQKSVKDLAFAKLIWQMENGVFIALPSPQINLRKNEICYLAFDGKLLERKTVNKGYKSVSSSFSIPVVKGVRYRVGSSRSVPIKEEVLLRHPGGLFLTNYRVVFSSGKNSFQIPFNKLLTFEVYSNGIDLVVEGYNYTIELGGQEAHLFATGLASALRNHFDDDNEVKAQALKEIEASSVFVDLSPTKAAS